MRLSIKNSLFTASFLSLSLLACKKWEEHTAVSNPALTRNLAAEISTRPNLSKFKEYLVKSGLDKELDANKNFTVWAPTDAALQALDPAVVADSAKLRHYISNHIAYQSYYTSTASPQRIVLLNGKNATLAGKKFDEANITEADFSTGNGVLHVLDKAVSPLPNIWEYINSTTTQYQQNAYIVSQNFNGFDPSLAVVDGISSTTGLPVYKPGTGLVPRNRYNDQVYDLKKEDAVYTYFLLTDAALQTEVDSLKTFYKTGTADSTYNLAAWSVLKDAVVEGLYTADQLPTTLTSRFGVTIPIHRNNIVATHRVSNGIVHVVTKLDFTIAQKIPGIVVQGENPRGFFRPTGVGVDVRSTTFYRERVNPATGQPFKDIFVYNHGVASLNVQYTANNVPAAKYKVYWVAVNDTIRVNAQVNPVSFQQRLAMGTPASATFAYRAVATNVFAEVYLGDYTHAAFGPLHMYLTAANSTAAGTNSLTLDYIRLEPQY